MDNMITNLDLMTNLTKNIFEKKFLLKEKEQISRVLNIYDHGNAEELKKEIQEDKEYLEILTDRHNKFVEKLF